MVQWLGLFAFTVQARVQFLVRELRSPKMRDMAKKRKRKKEKLQYRPILALLQAQTSVSLGSTTRSPHWLVHSSLLHFVMLD